MKIAVVILNWNGKVLLEKYLPSLIKYSQEASIYVIDNASKDESVSYLKSHYPEIGIVPLSENYGFAQGYNKGLKSIDADVFCLLNNDVEVTPNWLTPIKKTFEQTSIAIAQPLILDEKKKSHFEYAGAAGGFLDAFGFPYCRGRIFDTLEKNEQQYPSAKLFWASGACFFVRKETWDALGGFDEDFFMHQEEIDFCWRAHHLNLEVGCVSESSVFHLGAASLAQSPRKVFYNHRNSLWMLQKNLPTKRLFPILFLRMILDGIAALRYLVGGSPQSFIAVLKAHFAFYKTWRKTHKKRTKTAKKSTYYHTYSIVYAYFVLKKCEFFKLNPIKH